MPGIPPPGAQKWGRVAQALYPHGLEPGVAAALSRARVGRAE